MINFILSVLIVIIASLGILTISMTLFSHFQKDQVLSKDHLRMFVLMLILGVSILVDKTIYLWSIEY